MKWWGFTQSLVLSSARKSQRMTTLQKWHWYTAREHQYSNLCLVQTFPAFLIIWLVILLAETNRTPFDFSEGESELVSGFNIEYASTGFVLIFLSEYAIILLFSSSSVLFFTNTNLFSYSRRLIRICLAGV